MKLQIYPNRFTKILQIFGAASLYLFQAATLRLRTGSLYWYLFSHMLLVWTCVFSHKLGFIEILAFYYLKNVNTLHILCIFCASSISLSEITVVLIYVKQVTLSLRLYNHTYTVQKFFYFFVICIDIIIDSFTYIIDLPRFCLYMY